MSSITESGTKILIIGGGVGGLTLAQALLKRNIPFRIFERDTSKSYRAQGYRIRISGDGVHALQKCLPKTVWDTLETSAAEGAAGMCQLDALTGEKINIGPPQGALRNTVGPSNSSQSGRFGRDADGKLHGMQHEAMKPIVVDRTVMRQVLLSGLDDHIEYGKAFEHYEITNSGVTAYFTDGTAYHGDFLVGADGVNSRVRQKYLPQLNPVDTTGRCIYGKTYLTDDLTMALNRNAQGSMAVIQQRFENGTPLTLFLESTRFPNPNAVRMLNPETGKAEPLKDYIYWVLISQQKMFPFSTADLLHLTPAEAAELSNQLTTSWHESLKPILTEQSVVSASALRIVSALPNIPSWEPSTRITLLGDAAHPMPPTAGLGAVSALRDVESLVDAITEGITKESIGRYEENSRDFAGEAVKGSRLAGAKFFGQIEWDEAKQVEY